MRAVFVFLRDKFMRAGLVLLIVIVEVMAIYWFGQSSFTQPFINQCKQPNEICNIIINSRGAWTLITLIVSAPVAYVIWFFRDANTQKQIENQRKDVNLKEFQKIAEWVSGGHLVEEKITEKSKTTKEDSEQETACEYSRQPEKQNIATFSKQDGAVGLQIAAIYMLLPFYRGDHGEDFRRPAFNLLTATWLSLFSKVENIQEGQALAEKPLAVAITEVFFAEGGLVYSTEAKYKHLLVNLYLPFVDLTLPGLSEKALRVFAGKNCRGIDLHGAILQETYLENADLKGTNLWGVNFTEANLRKVDLRWANLRGAKLWGTDLREADLTEAYVMEADFMGADLGRVNLQNANLGYVYLEGTHLERANLRCANLFGAQLSERKFNQLSIDVNQVQKADFIILALVEPTVSTHSYQLTATRKTETSTHWIGEKFKRTIFSYQLNVQKTKELNQANWEIEIKELPSNAP
jgi:hypothetical protein